jgi:hypothetical protein
LASRCRFEFLTIGQTLQSLAEENFPSELTNYTYALQNIIRTSTGESRLSLKFTKLTHVMRGFKIELSDSDDATFEKRSAE